MHPHSEIEVEGIDVLPLLLSKPSCLTDMEGRSGSRQRNQYSPKHSNHHSQPEPVHEQKDK